MGASIMLEARLEPPCLPAGAVLRRGLLARIAAGRPRLVVASAPAGYGKTMLLAQYAYGAERPVAWLTADAGDDDPRQLAADLAAAVGRVVALDPRVVDATSGSRKTLERVALPGIMNALGAGDGAVLVMDDLHEVRAPDARALIAWLCEHLPPRAQLLIGTRGAPSLPPCVRLGGGLMELGPADLALGEDEAGRMLRAAGMPGGDTDADALVRRTEGWPAGLAMAIESGRDDVAREILGEYLARELLVGRPPETVDLILAGAVLEPFCAPLCDAVLGRDDSAAVIGLLQEEGVPLVPGDPGSQWYRFPRLFGEALRGELARRDGAAADALLRAAAEWHRRRGEVEEAVARCLAGHDQQTAVEMVVAGAPALLRSGEAAGARAWIGRFDDRDLLDSGALALTGAGLAALHGEKERARRFIALAERAAWQGPGPMGETSREAALALAGALHGGEGVSRMRPLAQAAYDREPVGNPAHEAAALALGVSLALLGRSAEAAPLLEEAVALGAARGTITVVGLVELARIALADGMREDAERHVGDGLALARELGLREWPGCAALLAAAAACEVAAGRDGRAHLERALPLLVRGAPYPWCSIATLTSLGATATAVRALDLAADLLGRARRELTRYPDAGILPRALARAEHRLEDARGGAGVLPDHLTAAELRVLELLPTHLRVDEIGEALHLSKSTIKSHLGAIYRKLGVCRRSDAVASALRHGILEANERITPEG